LTFDEVFMKTLIALLAGLLFATAAFADSLVLAKTAELSAVDGTYVGNVHLLRSNKDYAAEFQLRLVRMSQEDGESFPIVTGLMTFPVLESSPPSEAAKCIDLIEATGYFMKVFISEGFFDSAKNTLQLPFSIPAYTRGNYGEIDATLSTDHLVGVWMTKPMGQVATFDLVKKQ
jgi:hypothetical protein